MKYFEKRIKNAKLAIDGADYILIGAGAGLSDAAGIKYSGKRFEDNFHEFISKYNMTDMYSSSFYNFNTEEEKWAYWAKHISLNRYIPVTDLYKLLYDLLANKKHFVLTSNVDHQFWKAGFNDKNIFATQGDYGLFQCAKACHNELYYNGDIIKEMVAKTNDCKIPSDLVPKCPVCGGKIDVNLRKDSYFVQNEDWYIANDNYSDFKDEINDKKVVFLELGVGFNTPVIIRYPFEQMTFDNPNSTLIRINRDFPEAIAENINRTISFDEDILSIINSLIH